MTYRYSPAGPRVIAAALTVALLAGLAPAAASAAVPAGAVLPLGRRAAEHRHRMCYRVVAGGAIVVPAGSDSFFARNPRTIAGTSSDGRIVLATIDGRSTTSVGTTLDETAAVAQSLGLRDAINLDGGGSTAMVARGALVNQPSGGTERAVGDALVLTEAGAGVRARP